MPRRLGKPSPGSSTLRLGSASLTKNTLFNLLGQVLPLAVAVVAIPWLIGGLGIERFGILTLAWVVLGYFSLFDLGLGRAVTQQVAQRLGRGERHTLAPLLWTSLIIMGLLGMVGGMIIALLSSWLIGGVLKIPPALGQETLPAFYLLAVAIPIVTTTTGLRGFLEAHHRFGLVNIVRGVMGALLFLGPLLVLPFTNHLAVVVAALVVIRLLAWLVYGGMCLYIAPALRVFSFLKRSALSPLLRMGGWLTVTNIVGPLMTYFDRFIIGALISVSAVAFYATPYEAVSALAVIPAALAGVLFPSFAASSSNDPQATARLLERGVKYTFILMFAPVLVMVTLAYEGLYQWLGEEFAQESVRVLQWLAIGRFINNLAQVPFAFLQGVGRSDFTAKLHLAELPAYLLVLWWLIGALGIEGAALAWMLRVLVDALSLFARAQRLLPHESGPQRHYLSFVLAAGILVIPVLPMPTFMKGLFLLAVLPLFAFFVWRYLLDSDDKRWIFSLPGIIKPAGGRVL